MSADSINEWVHRAKNESGSAEGTTGGVKVVRNQHAQPSIGTLIMALSDKIRPHIAKMCEGVRNNEGMLMQPAHIRGISLQVAQGLVKDHQLNSKQSA